jgi:hypothetical protein
MPLLAELLFNDGFDVRELVKRNGAEQLGEPCDLFGTLERLEGVVGDGGLLGRWGPLQQVVGGALEELAEALDLAKVELVLAVVDDGGGKAAGEASADHVGEGARYAAGGKKAGEVK